MIVEVTIRCTLGEWDHEFADQFRRAWLTGIRGSLETAALVFSEGAGWRWRAWFPLCSQHEEGTADDQDSAKRAADEAVTRMVERHGR